MTDIWTGDINDPFALDATVGFYDTTLRDGEQTPGVVFLPDEKLEIAKLIDKLGVQRIEAGFPAVSDQDREACQMINEAGLEAEVWGFCRAVRSDVQLISDLGFSSTVVEAPISDAKLEAYGLDRPTIVERITSAVRLAVDEGIHVAFFGVDSTRADNDFYAQVYTEALEAGASEICIVDTLGIASPEAAARLVSSAKEFAGAETAIHYHGHNDFGLSTAGAIAAVREGARWIHGCINGMGERAGNANIPEVALALKALYDVETDLHLEHVREVANRVAQIAGYTFEPYKPAIGEYLFRRESGAIAMQFHHPPAVEPYSASLVGAERSIALGKKSGVASLRIVAKELDLDLPDEFEQSLLAAVKEAGIKRHGLVPEDEFTVLLESLKRQAAAQ